MHRTLTSLGTIAVTCAMLACSGDAPVSPGAESSPVGVLPRPPGPNIDSAITQRYLHAFAEAMPDPAFFGCGAEKITTTAYLRLPGRRARLLTLYTSIDGQSVIRSSSGTVMTPAGAFRALVAIVSYPEIFTADALPLWEAAQRAISNDYASFTAAVGHAGPLVTFEHTNVMLDASQVANPRSSVDVKAALKLQGWNVEEYDFLISLNLAPASEGGFAGVGSFDPAFIYMGNFGSFRAPLTAAHMTSIAGAVYYHEVSHHWGWPGTHDWRGSACPPGSGGYAAGLSAWLPAVLFGWEDVDGDGVPEIIDSTPYGRPRSP